MIRKTMRTSTLSTRTQGFLIALLSAAVLSSTSILIRYLTQTYHMPAILLAFWRAFFAVVTLLVGLRVLKPRLLRTQRQNLVFLLFYGLVLALFNSIWTLSVALNGAAIATVLAYSSAGFSALLGWALLKESLGWAKILAVIASMGGCVLVSGALQQASWDANTPGILFGVFSGLFYAGYSLMGRTASQRGLNPWTTLLYTFSFAAVFLMLFNLVPGDLIPGTAATPSEFFWLGDAAVGWGVLILLAAGPTVAGFGLINVSLGFLPSSVTTLILTTEPVFTAVTAYFFLGEMLTGVQMGGGLLILTGVVVLTLWDKPTPVEL